MPEAPRPAADRSRGAAGIQRRAGHVHGHRTAAHHHQQRSHHYPLHRRQSGQGKILCGCRQGGGGRDGSGQRGRSGHHHRYQHGRHRRQPAGSALADHRPAQRSQQLRQLQDQRHAQGGLVLEGDREGPSGTGSRGGKRGKLHGIGRDRRDAGADQPADRRPFREDLWRGCRHPDPAVREGRGDGQRYRGLCQCHQRSGRRRCHHHPEDRPRQSAFLWPDRGAGLPADRGQADHHHHGTDPRYGGRHHHECGDHRQP